VMNIPKPASIPSPYDLKVYSGLYKRYPVEKFKELPQSYDPEFYCLWTSTKHVLALDAMFNDLAKVPGYAECDWNVIK